MPYPVGPSTTPIVMMGSADKDDKEEVYHNHKDKNKMSNKVSKSGVRGDVARNTFAADTQKVEERHRGSANAVESATAKGRISRLLRVCKSKYGDNSGTSLFLSMCSDTEFKNALRDPNSLESFLVGLLGR